MNKITITLNGPYLVVGAIPLAHQHIVTNAKGESISWREGKAVAAPATDRYALCRCGQSATKPFCDGAHQRVGSRQWSAFGRHRGARGGGRTAAHRQAQQCRERGQTVGHR